MATLATYNFTLKYRPGASNADADGLSRLPYLTILPEVIKTLGDKQYPYIQSLQMIQLEDSEDEENEETCVLDHQLWRKRQREDLVLGPFIHALSQNKAYTPSCTEGEILKRESKNMFLQRGVLVRNMRQGEKLHHQLVLPIQFRIKALHACHDDHGHLGRDKSLALLTDRVFWPKMYRDIDQWISSCQRCIMRKRTPDTAPLTNIKTTQPLELICMDYVTLESSKGGFSNILVIIDHFTKYAVAVPTKNMSAKTTASSLFDNFILHYGFPKRMLSDQGGSFINNVLKELCKMAGVDCSKTTSYHPMGNGLCERFNRSLLSMLGTLRPDDKIDWKKHVAPLVHAYNCTKHDSTGFSPYKLMFGREPRLALDIVLGIVNTGDRNKSYPEYVAHLKENLDNAYRLSSANIKRAQNKQKAQYDKKVHGAVLETGDRILVRDLGHKGRHKLANKWEETPYIVDSQPNIDIPVYIVRPELEDRPIRTLHRNHLLPIGSIPITNGDHINRTVLRLPTNKPSNDVSHSQLDDYDRDTHSDDDMWVVVPLKPDTELDTQELQKDDIDIPDLDDENDDRGLGDNLQQNTGDEPNPRLNSPNSRHDDMHSPVIPPRRSNRERRRPARYVDDAYIMTQIHTVGKNEKNNLLKDLIEMGVTRALSETAAMLLLQLLA